MLISNENTQTLFAPFKQALGEVYPKVCNDAKAYYGRVDKNIKAEGGDWKLKGKVAKGEVANKATYTLLLDANNPITPLTLAAMDVRDFSKRHAIDPDNIQVPLPKACLSWIDQAKKDFAKQGEVESEKFDKELEADKEALKIKK